MREVSLSGSCRRPIARVAASVLALLLCGFSFAACGLQEGEETPAETPAQALISANRLHFGEVLIGDRNQTIVNGPGRRFELMMQWDCNLVLYDRGFERVPWTTHTQGRGTDCVATIESGQLRIFRNYHSARRLVWSSGNSSWGTYLQLDPYGDLALFDETGRTVWGGGTRVLQERFLTHSQEDRLLPGEGLLASYDETLRMGPMRLTMQHDCNLVLYDHSVTFHGAPVWKSNTHGQGWHCFAEMQTDGNLVVYSQPPFSPRRKVWASGTNGRFGAWLRVQSDGNLVIYLPNSVNAVWASNTFAQVPGQQPRDRHPGCRFSRAETACGHPPDFAPGVLVCRDVYSCPGMREEEEMWTPCGFCVSGFF